MKYTLQIATLALLLLGCRSNHTPDVSSIQIELHTERFEKDFFAIDTLQLDAALSKLNKQHPGFTQDFLFNILGTSVDSTQKDIPGFLRSYRTLYDNSITTFADFGKPETEIRKAMQFIHYYFPTYKLPTRLITFVGPINSYGNIITTNALAVGLQLYMGKNYPLYLSEMGQQMYPLFISRRFSKEYIPVNCVRNMLDDMYPNNNLGRPLLEQMVESGKRLYVLGLLMPEAPDSIRTGYTQQQLDECYASEKNIWSFFIQNEMLYKSDPNLTRDYMNDAPNTPALGEASPGNIGQFVGWQIVKKWMDRNPKTTPAALMQKNARALFDEAKYKPR